MDKQIRVRDYSIDLLKVFATIFVFISHSANICIADKEHTILMNFIILTTMPIFTFASGLVARGPEKITNIKSFLKVLRKNLISLLYPCLTFMIITVLIGGVYNHNMIKGITEFIKNPESNLWYLWVLFIIATAFSFYSFISSVSTKKIILRRIIVIGLSVLTIFGIFVLYYLNVFEGNFLGLKFVFYYFVFYIFGYLFSLIKNKINFEKTADKLVIGSLFVVSLAIYISIIVTCDSVMNMSDNDLFQIFEKLAGNLCACFVWSIICICLSKLNFFIRMSHLGKFSLEAYYFHVASIHLMSFAYASAYSGSNLQYLFLIIQFTVFLLIVIACVLVSYYTPFLHFLLFGKSWSRYNFEKKLINKNTTT